MKTLTFFLSALLCTFSLLGNVLPLHLKEVDFAYSETHQCVATLTLSDKTTWKRPCIYSDEAVLGQWAVGDEVTLSTDNHEGIRLENLRCDSHVYAFLEEVSLVKPLHIADIVVVPQRRSLFRHEQNTLCLSLSDGSKWKGEDVKQFSNRWCVGQPVLMSRCSDKSDKMLNVLLPWDPRYADDRSVDVYIVEVASPLP